MSPIFDSTGEIMILFNRNNFQKPDCTHSLFLTFCFPSYVYCYYPQAINPHPVRAHLLEILEGTRNKCLF